MLPPGFVPRFSSGISLLEADARGKGAGVRTVEDTMVIESRWGRAVRDLRVLRRMSRLVWGYFVTGALVRRRYRTKERHGEVFFVDEELGR